MSDSGKLINFLAQRNDIFFLYWIFGATVALIALFFIARLVRNLVAGRVRQVEAFGMDFDAVGDMLDKGLLSPDEAKRVKSVLGRHFSRFYESRLDGDSADNLPATELLAAEMAGKTGGQSPLARPKPPSGQAPDAPAEAAGVAADSEPETQTPQPEAQTPASPPAEPQPDDVEIPLDVLDMYRMGMVSREEFQALRRFYAAKAERAKADSRPVAEAPAGPNATEPTGSTKHAGAPVSPFARPARTTEDPAPAAPPTPPSDPDHSALDTPSPDDRFDALDRKMHEMGMVSRDELERRLEESETDRDEK